jgi:hypothetical protein
MDLIKIRLKPISFLILFLFFNIIPTFLCIIELPIKAINIQTIPKYNNIKLDTDIPLYLEKILQKHQNNSMFENNIKIFTEAGDAKIIKAFLLAIKIEMGSSNQEFNLILDTGSSITWVAAKNSKDLYKIVHHYDPYLSSTSKNLSENFTERYGSGSCKGYYFKDRMKYINNKTFDIIFGAAESTNMAVNEVDGIVGLSKIYDDESKSFMHMMCRGGVTKSRMFSFKLGINATDGTIGKFYIGKHDDFNSEKVVTCEMKNSNYYEKYLWACEMSSFSIINNNKNIKLTSDRKVSVIFDSGTNVIFLPLFYLEDIKKDLIKINCYIRQIEVYTKEERNQIICVGDIPDFHLIIGGHTFILPGEHFFYLNHNIGFSKIMFLNSLESESESDDDVFIIGSPFFMFFHILFDSYSKELHFYPENSEYLIKGNWWHNSYHIFIIVIFILLVILLIVFALVFISWIRNNKIDNDKEEYYEITSFLGLL